MPRKKRNRGPPIPSLSSFFFGAALPVSRDARKAFCIIMLPQRQNSFPEKDGNAAPSGQDRHKAAFKPDPEPGPMRKGLSEHRRGRRMLQSSRAQRMHAPPPVRTGTCAPPGARKKAGAEFPPRLWPASWHRHTSSNRAQDARSCSAGRGRPSSEAQHRGCCLHRTSSRNWRTPCRRRPR